MVTLCRCICLIVIDGVCGCREREREIKRERKPDVPTSLRVLVLSCCPSASLFLSLSLSLSCDSVLGKMATCHRIFMHGAAAGARATQRHTSPSYIHRAATGMLFLPVSCARADKDQCHHANHICYYKHTYADRHIELP